MAPNLPRRSVFQLFLLLFISTGCGEAAKNSSLKGQDLSSREKETTKPEPRSDQAPAPVDPPHILPVDQMLPEMPPPILPIFVGLGGGGGGGSRRASNVNIRPCENGTSDCNDHNPCTADRCNDADICIHTLDSTKSEFGSCERDSDPCTIGKCVANGTDIICHEQNRAFIPDPIGCNDGNDCTADSCIRAPQSTNTKVQFDGKGNVILENEHQCISEIINGLACFVEEQCVFGVCQESGTGDPGDDFQIACVESAENQPQVLCPAPAGSDSCTLAVCTVGIGCQVVDAPDNTACNDLSACTENDICTGGICLGTALDCDDSVACTTDFCDGNGVCQNIPNNNVCDPSLNECQQSICDTVAGCILANVPTGFPCTDADPCTLEDSCDGLGACEGLATLSCPDDDLEDCLIAACTSGIGCGFENALEGASCEGDDSICTVDTCDDAGTCTLGTPLTCTDDGNPCTLSSCDANVGCINGAGNDGATCNDNNTCTTGESCLGGICQGGTDLDCDDDNICTDDSCAAIGGCLNINLNGPVGNACEITTEGVFGICINGYTQCDNGVELTDMCVQIFRSGDKEEVCDDADELDENCNGLANNADPACLRRAFMTSTTYTGNLVLAANLLVVDNLDLTDAYNCSADVYTGGSYLEDEGGTSGVNAADCLCRERAASQGDELRCADNSFSCWKAWISDSTALGAPANRFNMASGGGSSVPIYEVDASGSPDVTAPIAVGGWQDLTVCGVDTGSDIEDTSPHPRCLDDLALDVDPCAANQVSWRDETGGVRLSGDRTTNDIIVWTNTNDSGNVANASPTNTCGEWSQAAPFVPNGSAGSGLSPSPRLVDPECSETITYPGWTDPETKSCQTNAHLYCFEDL